MRQNLIPGVFKIGKAQIVFLLTIKVCVGFIDIAIAVTF